MQVIFILSITYCTTSNKLIFLNWGVVAYNVVLVVFCAMKWSCCMCTSALLGPLPSPPSRSAQSMSWTLCSMYGRFALAVCLIYTGWGLYVDAGPRIHPPPCAHVHPLRFHLSSCPAHSPSGPFCRFHPCALICNICFFLSDLLHSVFCLE